MTLPNLTLKRGNGANLYGQLVDGLERAIQAGELKDGERLPSERQLAAQLGLSRTTVVSSYRELESRGLVRSHVGRGTFVCASSEATDAPFAWRGKVSAETAERPVVSFTFCFSSTACSAFISPSLAARWISSQEAICISRVVRRMLSVA